MRAPFFGANDTEATVKAWLVESGSYVETGVELCELETTKATIEVSCDASGFFFPTVAVGDTVKTNQLIGLVGESADFDAAAYVNKKAITASNESFVTTKARILIQKHGLDEASIVALSNNGRVTEDDVTSYLRNEIDRFSRIGIARGRKVAIIGGVGGGGALIVADAISRMPDMQAVAIYDRDERFVGKHVLGVPIVGAIDLLEDDLRVGRVDGVVIAFNRDLQERQRVFDALRSRGVQFFNVIDPSVDIRSDVEVGYGNVILGHVYIGACSRIGHNNFISANVALEHGNVLGSGCAFGPGVFTSGNVTIGDRVRFGTGIFIEPGLTIGEDAVIGSGHTVVTSIRQGSVLTSSTKV